MTIKSDVGRITAIEYPPAATDADTVPPLRPVGERTTPPPASSTDNVRDLAFENVIVSESGPSAMESACELDVTFRVSDPDHDDVVVAGLDGAVPGSVVAGSPPRKLLEAAFQCVAR